MQIADNAVILFQGDSITDAGRNREDGGDLGFGYAALVAAWMTATYPAKNLKFLNRGISGNRTVDLRGRWQTDCLDLKPDWVSILIGINDTWRRYDYNDITTAENYAASYRDLLEQTTKKLSARLILLEPFVLPIPPDRAEWREDLYEKIEVVRQLARDYHALYVPLDGAFAAAAAQRPMADWMPDGVHPTLAGHMLIAQQWMRAVGAL